MKSSILVIITAIFSLAFVTRAIGTVDDARQQFAEMTDKKAAAHPASNASLKQPPYADVPNPDFVGLAAMIKSRTAEIEQRLAAINEREETLKAVEMRVDAKLKELEAAQASLAEVANRVDAANGKDIKALADMYANMKPAQAGAIFNAMEPAFAAGFLTAIRAESAAAILASMEPQKAYAVSVIIAGRNVEN